MYIKLYRNALRVDLDVRLNLPFLFSSEAWSTLGSLLIGSEEAMWRLFTGHVLNAIYADKLAVTLRIARGCRAFVTLPYLL